MAPPQRSPQQRPPPRLRVTCAPDRTMLALIALALLANVALFVAVTGGGTGPLSSAAAAMPRFRRGGAAPAGFRSLVGGAASGSAGEEPPPADDGGGGYPAAAAEDAPPPPQEEQLPPAQPPADASPGPARSMLVEGMPDGEPLDDPPELAAATASGKAYTHQTCYIDGDESETCVYDGVLCFDGTSPVVVVDRPTLTQPLVDSQNDCMDFRYLEPSVYEWSGCRHTVAGERRYVPSEHPASLRHDSPIVSSVRWWGPHNRHHLFYREVAADDVFGPAGGFRGLTVDDAPGPVELPYAPTEEYLRQHAPADGGEPEPTPPAAVLRPSRRTRHEAANLTIDWLPDWAGLYLVALPGQAWSNPYHFLASLVGPLYASLRSNASGPVGSNPLDGYMHGLGTDDVPGTVPSIHRDSPTPNRMAFRSGPQWDLPPMTVVAGVGDSGREIASVHALDTWFAGTLSQAVQPDSTVLFNDLMSRLSPGHMLCARRGVVPSHKPKLFTAPADAWIFRQRAHMLAGLDPNSVLSHPRLPPRHITLIDRLGMHGRGIYNKGVLMAALAAADVPFTVVDRMDELSFAEQVRLMSGTGLLIAPHGAHLANMAFLPARAAVIELFPPLLKKNGYRYTAQLFNLHYFPVYR
jgi:hypothetical protein